MKITAIKFTKIFGDLDCDWIDLFISEEDFILMPGTEVFISRCKILSNGNPRIYLMPDENT